MPLNCTSGIEPGIFSATSIRQVSTSGMYQKKVHSTKKKSLFVELFRFYFFVSLAREFGLLDRIGGKGMRQCVASYVHDQSDGIYFIGDWT